jgi:hypothetical protein
MTQTAYHTTEPQTFHEMMDREKAERAEKAPAPAAVFRDVPSAPFRRRWSVKAKKKARRRLTGLRHT